MAICRLQPAYLAAMTLCGAQPMVAGQPGHLVPSINGKRVVTDPLGVVPMMMMEALEVMFVTEVIGNLVMTDSVDDGNGVF